ncbi:glycosyltransferase [Amycolatopsis sp. NPDC059027]|uniref:glycosyltransferase n=1 Tax=Amycolatopsis sp. NPDC059027 TaxID=3346709 RepID=UPI00366DD7D4
MRLLFSSGAGHSHIAPMLPLATAARDAGNDVVFVTGSRAVRYPEAAGLHTVAIDGTADEASARYAEKYPLERIRTLPRDEALSSMIAYYLVGVGAGSRLGEMLAFVRDWEPDLVVGNLAERASVLAADLAGVPYVMHAIGPPKPAGVMAAAWEVAHELVRPYGVERLPSREGVPYLDIWPEALCPRDTAWEYPTRWPLRPENVVPVDAERPAVLAGMPYERTVYVTSGTSHNTRPGVLEAMIAGLRGVEVNVIVTIGRDGDRARFGAQPDHVRIEHFVPQEQLLSFVDVVVCHAGAGTILGALAHGVPLVVSPLGTDQFDMADQVVDAGVGLLAGSGAPSEEAVRAAVLEILGNSSFRERAAVIAGKITAMPAPMDILDRLKAYAASGS